MRNLKRVLSLALALVMMLGMMVIGANAASTDFADADEITNTEAVEVMAALGVLEGSNGKFDPKGTLTREQGAKIICYMLMGPANAEKLAGTNVFTDVAADRWSAPYIAYCANLGILAGVGDGTFDPEGVLTDVAFGKMLLVALGYNAETEGYVGKDWATAIGTDMIVAGIADGAVTGTAVTREKAAQMAFNTLTATKVEYLGGTNIITPDGTTITSGGTRQFVAGSTAVGANWDNTTGDGKMQFCEQHFSTLKCTATAASADTRASKVWAISGTPVVTTYEKPAFTFTADLTAASNKTVENALTGYTFTSTVAIVDGKTTGTAAASAANIKALTSNGVKVEVYATGKNVHCVTVTNTGLVEITNVNAATGAITLTVRADAWSSALNTTIAKDTTDPVYNALAAIGKDGFALVTAAWDNSANYDVVTVAAPTVVTGKVTYIDGNSTTNTALTIDGKAYTIAATNDGAITAAATFTVSNTTERNLYLDPYGYALYNKDTAAAITTMPKTIYVAKAYTSTDKWGAAVQMAQGVLNDGTVVYVQTAAAATDGTLYTYTVNPTTGVYTLTATTVGDNTTVGIDNVTTGTTITATTKANDGWFFAADVQFMYVTGSGDTLKVEIKDGMQIGQALATNDWYVIAKDANNNYVIKTVIIEGAAAPDVAEDLIFVKTAWSATNYTSTKLNSKGATLYGYEAYVNGAKTTIWVTAAAAKAQGIYTYTVDAANEAITVGSAAANYVGTAEALSAITVIGDKAYWDVATSTYDNYDISGATVYDTTNNGLTSATALKAALTAGKTITVVYSYATSTQTIPVIYVVSCS